MLSDWLFFFQLQVEYILKYMAGIVTLRRGRKQVQVYTAECKNN